MKQPAVHAHVFGSALRSIRDSQLDCRFIALRSVVIARLKDDKVVAVDKVDQPMLVRDASGPRTLRAVLELLGFPDAGEWFTKGRVDEHVDPFEDPAVRRLPMLVVLPGGLVPNQTHSVLPVEVMHLSLTRTGALVGVEEPTGVGG